MADKSTYKVEVLCSDVAAKLHLERGVVKERLAEPFEMKLSLYSDDLAIDLQKALGARLAVKVTTGNGERFFHGIVTDFAFVGTSSDAKQRLGHYQATVRPQLWLLGQGQRSRVFQDQKVTDIVKTVCSETGFSPAIDSKLAVSFEHAVQYRETDLHFASRMMERHGLYYFFRHEKGKHELAVVDGLSGHKEFGIFAYAADGSPSEEYQVAEWRAAMSIRSGLYHVTGTQHLTPSAKVQEKAKSRFKAAPGSALEVYDFEATTECPKPYLDVLAKVRQEAVDAGVEEYTGRSASLLFAVGGLFKLKGHPRDDQNKDYLLVSAVYEIPGMPSASSSAVGGQYQVAFTAIDSKTPFRPPVRAERPVVQGPHTAVVTEETDDLGRVKVRFHWGNKEGELESCYARVSQNWAGKGWGGTFMPHLGQEMIVEFLDGDPDQPLVTGRVYNKENMPPLSLPGSKSQSIIRDHGGNEIMMEGKGGAQKMRLWCPKEETEIILGNSEEHKCKGDLKLTFEGGEEKSLGKDMKVKVAGSAATVITGKFELECTEKHEENHGSQFETVYGARHETILGLHSKTMGARNEDVVGANVEAVYGLMVEVNRGYLIERRNVREICETPDAHFKHHNHVHKGETFRVTAPQRLELNSDNFYCNVKKVWLNGCEEATLNIKKGTFKGDNLYHHISDMFHVDAKQVQLKMSKLEVNGKTVFNDGALEVSN